MELIPMNNIGTIYEPGSGVSAEPNHPDLRLLSFRTIRNQFVLFTNHLIYGLFLS
jgi:hypothetical protein